MADGCSVKTLACFSSIQPSSRCLIIRVPSRKEKELLFICKGDRFLYVIENGRHLNTYSFPSNVIYFEVLHQIVTAVTDDGRVWRTAFTKHTIKKNKQISEECSSSNQAIFSELLCKETKNKNKADDLEYTAHVTGISPSHTILFEPRIQVVFSVEDSLISLGINDTGCIISNYTSKIQHENNVSYKQAALKLFLNNPGHLHKDKIWPIPLLCFREKTNAQATHVLERKLFDAMMPTRETDQMKMAGNTPLLFIGTPDGQVWACDVSNEETGSKLINYSSSSYFKLLCHLEQGVIGLHLIQFPQLSTNHNSTARNHIDDDNVVSNMVVMIGKRGKCVLVYNQTDKTLKYVEHSLAGPICCSSIKSSKDCTCIVYSNGKEICINKLSVTNKNTIDRKELHIIFSPIYICIPKVCFICPLNQKMSDNISMTVMKAVAMTTNGKLLEITLPLQENKVSFVGMHSKEPGCQLKELLIEIEKVALQTNIVEKDIEALDKVLEQLNYASTLISRMTRFLSTSKTLVRDQSMQCIQWTVVPKLLTSSDPFTSKTQYSLEFIMTNQSSISLSSQWSVLISVINKNPVVSYSLALETLHRQSANEFVVNIPLQESVDMSQCILVEAFLSCDVSSMLATLPSEIRHVLDMNKTCLVVSLGQKVIDILNFAPLSIDSLSKDVCKFSFPTKLLHLEDLNELSRTQYMTDTEFHTLMLPVSKSIVSSIMSVCQSVGRSKETIVLHFLVRDLNDNHIHNQDTKTSALDSKTNCCNLMVQVAAGINSTDEICIIMKASGKTGLLMLLEAIIARLKSVWMCPENLATCAAEPDVQGILTTIQNLERKVKVS